MEEIIREDVYKRQIMSMAVLSGCGNSSEKKEDSKEEKTDEYTIGFSVSTLSNPFFVTMSDAADAKAKEMGIKIETLDAEDSSETQAQQVEDLILDVYKRQEQKTNRRYGRILFL